MNTLVLAATLFFTANQSASTDTLSKWNGFEKRDFTLDGRKAFIVVPPKPAKGKPWIWRTEFFGHEPQADIALIKKGYHAAYIDVQDLYGAPKALDAMDTLYDHLTKERGLSKKVVLEGFSRGGLFTLNWAARHPDRVACIYNDAPVCDFKSWPLGQGAGKASPADWQKCLKAYGFTQKQALEYDKNPVDNLKPLADAKIPILHVCGDADEVVPFGENTMLMYRRYRQMDGPMEVIAKPGVKHHPHSLKDPKRIVEFILKHAPAEPDESAADSTPAVDQQAEKNAMRKNLHLRGSLEECRKKFASGKGHVAFLGGSITEMEGYRPILMDQLKKRFPKTKFTFTNAGVSSTCSTTGAFRLAEDVLAKGPVDLLVVEFAVNDDQDARHSRKECIRGMEGVIRHTRLHNPKADIVAVHFVNEGMLAKIAMGEEPVSSGAHEEVANHYAVPSAHVARELARRIQAKTMTWNDYGGVHPAKPGNQLAADMVDQLLELASQGKEPTTGPTPYSMPKPLDPGSYFHGQWLPNSTAVLNDGWELSTPAWPQLKGECRPRFKKLDMLWTETPGALLTVPFQGKTLGAYVLAGPDAGTLEVSIDAGPFKPVPLKHAFSGGLHYPRTVILATDLEEGKHTARLRLAKGADKTAARIVRLAVD